MTGKVSLFNALSWSFTKMKMLRECARKFFFNYYGYRIGGSIGKDERSKIIFRLKYLKSIELLLGQSFHEVIKFIIENYSEETISPLLFRRLITKDIKDCYKKSKEGIQDWINNPSKNPLILEVFNNGDLPSDYKQRINEKVIRLADNIITNPTFNEIMKGNVKVIELDKFNNLIFNNVVCNVKIDALCSSGCKASIVDWKTSSHAPEEADIEQLLFYTYYVYKNYGISPENIEARLEYILLNSSHTFTFNTSDFDYAEKHISEDIALLKSYLADVERNIPLAEEYFQTTNCKGRCLNCPFKTVCLAN
jgi:hypothetical protein